VARDLWASVASFMLADLPLRPMAARFSFPAGGGSKAPLNASSTPSVTSHPLDSSNTVMATDAAGDEHVSLGVKAVTLLAVVVPLLGLAAAVVLLWGHGFSWVHLVLLLGMYLLTVLGITVGFHRLFTHRAFEAKRGVKAVFAVLGSMAVQGPLLEWVALHRRHHQHSDGAEDPHSPHAHGGGVKGVLRGMWHAHVGWLFKPYAAGWQRYVGDLARDGLLRRISALFPLWVSLGLLIPAVLGGVLTMTWTGVLLGFIWGGLTRIFLVHHVTWSINSVCHLWGSRPYETRGDQSRNNLVLGLLALGEGWHNNHHAFPTSARHGLRWWQIDASYWVIQCLAALGLAWKVRVPAAEALVIRRRG
jgi:stearoyl-CoA desaturase (delta-9 desaturase)